MSVATTAKPPRARVLGAWQRKCTGRRTKRGSGFFLLAKSWRMRFHRRVAFGGGLFTCFRGIQSLAGVKPGSEVR